MLQPQDQDVDFSLQVGLTTEISESPQEEEPKGPTMKDIFVEIKNMTEKGLKSVLMEVIFKKCTTISSNSKYFQSI